MSTPLTIFTPTYNRAYILERLYNSLVDQTNKDFVWLVVDDGSSDNSEAIIKQWMQEKKIDIQYVYKENHGMHSAHNVAFDHIGTPLCVCIDSDDYMPQDAVARILAQAPAVMQDDSLAGFIGLDADTQNKVIGTAFPEDIGRGSINQMIKKHKVRGDKKIVMKTDVVNRYPRYPLFENERLVPLGTLYLLMEQDYEFAFVNEIYCNVEYMPDGSTRNILRQYRKNPKGFAHERVLRIKYERGFKDRLRQWVHLVSGCLFIGSFAPAAKASHKWMLIAAFPLGVLLNLYIRLKTRK